MLDMTTAELLISKNREKILTSLTSKLKDQFMKASVDFDFAFKSYLSKSYEKYSKIKTLIYKIEPKFIYDFFECNDLVLENRKIDASDVNNVIDISKFVIIQGTGGIGKSTLMKHFFLNALYITDLIPIFVELKDLNDFDGELLDFLYFSLSKLGFTLEKKYFEYAMKTGCFLVLLDGYDEVITSKSDTLTKYLNDICDKYEKNYYIISSRPNDSFIKFQRFSLLSSIKFTKKQAISLIRKIDFNKDVKERFLKDLENNLYDRHESFASNPLLLNIMLLTYDNYAEIPDKLHIFYSNAFETLYTKHDATKAGYKREMRSDLPYDTFKKVFAEFCFRSYIKRQIEFSYDNLCENLQIVKRDIAIRIDDFIWDLTNAICVIYADGLSYKFTHRSFQEYFTAYYIKELSDVQQTKICLHLIDNLDSPLFDSTISMLSDMSNDRFEKNVVMPILLDIEEKINGEESRYNQFLSILVPRIIIHPNVKKSESNESMIQLGIGMPNNRSYIILETIRKYAKPRDNYSIDKVYEKKLYTQVIEKKTTNQNNRRTRNRMERSIKEIMRYKTLYSYIEKSWVGEWVSIATELLEILREKHANQLADIDELLMV